MLCILAKYIISNLYKKSTTFSIGYQSSSFFPPVTKEVIGPDGLIGKDILSLTFRLTRGQT